MDDDVSERIKRKLPRTPSLPAPTKTTPVTTEAPGDAGKLNAHENSYTDSTQNRILAEIQGIQGNVGPSHIPQIARRTHLSTAVVYDYLWPVLKRTAENKPLPGRVFIGEDNELKEAKLPIPTEKEFVEMAGVAVELSALLSLSEAHNPSELIPDKEKGKSVKPSVLVTLMGGFLEGCGSRAAPTEKTDPIIQLRSDSRVPTAGDAVDIRETVEALFRALPIPSQDLREWDRLRDQFPSFLQTGQVSDNLRILKLGTEDEVRELGKEFGSQAAENFRRGQIRSVAEAARGVQSTGDEASQERLSSALKTIIGKPTAQDDLTRLFEETIHSIQSHGVREKRVSILVDALTDPQVFEISPANTLGFLSAVLNRRPGVHDSIRNSVLTRADDVLTQLPEAPENRLVAFAKEDFKEAVDRARLGPWGERKINDVVHTMLQDVWVHLAGEVEKVQQLLPGTTAKRAVRALTDLCDAYEEALDEVARRSEADYSRSAAFPAWATAQIVWQEDPERLADFFRGPRLSAREFGQSIVDRLMAGPQDFDPRAPYAEMGLMRSLENLLKFGLTGKRHDVGFARDDYSSQAVAELTRNPTVEPSIRAFVDGCRDRLDNGREEDALSTVWEMNYEAIREIFRRGDLDQSRLLGEQLALRANGRTTRFNLEDIATLSVRPSSIVETHSLVKFVSDPLAPECFSHFMKRANTTSHQSQRVMAELTRENVLETSPVEVLNFLNEVLLRNEFDSSARIQLIRSAQHAVGELRAKSPSKNVAKAIDSLERTLSAFSP